MDRHSSINHVALTCKSTKDRHIAGLTTDLDKHSVWSDVRVR